MKRVRFLLIIWGTLFQLISCSSNRDFIIAKLYDEKSKQEVYNPCDYEIISFYEKDMPNALSETLFNPKVWFGGDIPFPSRNLNIVKADRQGKFCVPRDKNRLIGQFIVVLNKEKSIVSCYYIEEISYINRSTNDCGRDLQFFYFYDITCKNPKVGEEERREYYRKKFDDFNMIQISRNKDEYNVSNYYKFPTQNVRTKEQFVVPLYIECYHPNYLLIN